MNGKNTAYFLGANSPQGFYSAFDQLINIQDAHRVFCLKGGPGTGKSSFMGGIAATAEAGGHTVERIYCSSDPDSLDGIVITDLDVAFVDGTAPHVVDPKFPGAVDEIINLGDFWDREKLALNRDEIIRLCAVISTTFKKAYRYIGAANFLLRDCAAALSSALNMGKLHHYAEKFIRKNFRGGGAVGTEKRRFLSAITPKGNICLSREFAAACEQLYVVEDAFCAAPALLALLRDGALANGFDAVCYYCPMAPATKIEHLFIPALGLGITCSDDFHPYVGDFDHRISTQRFIDKEQLGGSKTRVKFNRKCAKSLLCGAYSALSSAKGLHDELEQIYLSAMDFEGVSALREKISAELML